MNYAEEHNMIEVAVETPLPHDTIWVNKFLHLGTFASLNRHLHGQTIYCNSIRTFATMPYRKRETYVESACDGKTGLVKSARPDPPGFRFKIQSQTGGRHYRSPPQAIRPDVSWSYIACDQVMCLA